MIEPAILDFGALPPQCETDEARIQVTNVCDEEQIVTAAALAPGADAAAFEIVREAALPAKLLRHQEIELGVRFGPPRAGSYSATLAVSTASSAAYVSRMVGSAFFFLNPFELRGTLADRNGDGFVDEADIFVTIDGEATSPISPSKARRWSDDPGRQGHRLRGDLHAPGRRGGRGRVRGGLRRGLIPRLFWIDFRWRRSHPVQSRASAGTGAAPAEDHENMNQSFASEGREPPLACLSRFIAFAHTCRQCAHRSHIYKVLIHG